MSHEWICNSFRMTIRPIYTCVLVATFCLVAQPTALAASRQAQERAARKACLTGDYTKGVAILSDLFVNIKDPVYIFNQGRCFEQNRRYEDAIARFEEYLRTAANTKLDDSDKAAAEKHITDCKELLAQLTGHPVAPPPASEASLPPPPPVAPAPAPSPPVVEVQPAPPPPQPTGSSGAGLRTAGIITASVGVAAVAAGVILNVKVNTMANDMQNTPGGYSPSKENDRKTFATLGWIGYGVGAACITTGAILYIVGHKSGPSDSTQVAIMPTFSAGQTGAVLVGAF
jgi:hypothetical protein